MAEQATKNNGLIMLFSGLLIGGAIAALFTPKSGRAIRTDIKEKTSKMQSEAKRIKNEAVNAIKQDTKKVKDVVKEEAAHAQSNMKSKTDS